MAVVIYGATVDKTKRQSMQPVFLALGHFFAVVVSKGKLITVKIGFKNDKLLPFGKQRVTTCIKQV